MTSQFTGWRFLVNFLLPPPLILTFLLVLPFPRNVRKGLLIFTNRVLSFTVAGGLKLAHFALLLSGVPLLDSGLRTYKHAAAAAESELTPNQKIGLLAKKWREERNFWIAAMAFTLWCLLTVLYAQVTRSLRLEDKLDKLQEELDEVRGVVREKPPAPKSRLPGFGFGKKPAAAAAGGSGSQAQVKPDDTGLRKRTPAGGVQAAASM